MKSKIQWILLLFVLVTLCSCGGISPSEHNEVQHEKKPQTVNATVNTIFKNSETSIKENRLENDFIRIWPNYVSLLEPPIWMQENVDGTEKKELALENISCVLWLTNDWIYYSCGEKDDNQRVFRVPIIHKEEVTYDTVEKELLFEIKTDDEYIQNTFFVTDTYIFYSRFDEDSEISTYYRYDIATGESTEVFTLESDDVGLEAELIQNECTNLPVTLESSFFLSSDVGIYRVYFDTLEMKTICTGENLDIENMAEHEGAVYFCGEIDGRKNDIAKIEWSSNNILKYDGKSEEITSVLTNTDLEEILEQIENTSDIDLIDENCYYCINAPYTYKDRLYIQVHTEAGARAFTQTSGKNVLLSAPFTNLEQWEMENNLTKYCLEQGMGDESPGTTVAAVIGEVYDGKALVAIVNEVEEPSSPSQNSQNLEGYSAIYNIDTGEIEKLEDEDYRVGQCYSY